MMERIKKIWSIICKILNAFFLVVLIGLIVILLYLAIGSKGNGLPFLQNYQMFTVLSGSMEPTLNVGGVIIVEKVDPMTLQEGDIITFISNDTSLSGQVVSHRIIQVVDNNNGRMFITKGDAIGSRSTLLPILIIGIALFISGKISGTIFGLSFEFYEDQEWFLLPFVVAMYDHPICGIH